MGGYISRVFTPRDPKDDIINDLKGQISNKNNTITGLNGTINRPLYNNDGRVVFTNADEISNKASEFINTSFNNNSGLIKLSSGYTTASNIVDDNLDVAKATIGNLTEQNKLLSSLPLNDYSISFIEVNTQNNLIDNQIKEIKDVYSTDNQKVNYQSDKITTLKYINYVLFLIYYVVFAFLIIVLLMYNITFTKQFKSLLVIIFILFPFVSDIVYQLIVYLYNFIYALLNGNAYTSNNY
jgi:hypothetical protein